MIIRRAEEKDVEGINKLLHQVQNVHAEGRPDIFKLNGIKYREAELKEIINNDERPIYVGVDKENRVLGYVFCVFEVVEEGSSTLQPIRTLYIDDLCVDEDLRGQKIGRQLYEYAVKVAEQNGCHRLTLHVWSCNPGAMEFYKKMGLSPVTTTMEKVFTDTMYRAITPQNQDERGIGMYSCRDRVSFSQIDYSGKLSVSGVVDAMQDCCMFHSEEVGRSSQELLKINRAWLVSAWQIIIKDRPKMGQEFITKTWPHQFKGFFGLRNFLVESLEGEVFACADSYWFFADVKTGKPVRVPKEESEVYETSPRYDMPKGSRKVSCPENLKFRQKITVCQSYLDTNGHMNNGQYIRLATNVLPDDFKVSELCAEYRLATHLGDEICLFTAEEDGKFYVIIADEKEQPYFLSSFK